MSHPDALGPRIVVRRFVDSDLHRIAEVFHDAVRRVNCRDYTPAQIEAWSPQVPEAGRLRNRLAGLKVWVAQSSGEVAGFCALGAEGYVDLLYVDSRWQRQGVARQLYEAAEAESRHEGVRRMSTQASITGRPFFESMGFGVARPQHVEVRGVLIPNFVMQKDLP